MRRRQARLVEDENVGSALVESVRRAETGKTSSDYDDSGHGCAWVEWGGLSERPRVSWVPASVVFDLVASAALELPRARPGLGHLRKGCVGLHEGVQEVSKCARADGKPKAVM